MFSINKILINVLRTHLQLTYYYYALKCKHPEFDNDAGFNIFIILWSAFPQSDGYVSNFHSKDEIVIRQEATLELDSCARES